MQLSWAWKYFLNEGFYHEMEPDMLGVFFLSQKSIYNEIIHMKEFITDILIESQV